ncbi:hypothetical protein [Dysgonomonas massiliensis]|uniref:hypothetical protein n=1 Tax=Dysgonomonas massiliensis TaxID=2040292 RepID=UPI00135AB741
MIVMFLTGVPSSRRKRTQKSLMPGPLIMAPRRMFLPFFRVIRLDIPSSTTIRRSPESSSTCSPLSHHADAELEPADNRTSLMSSGQSITVTAQNSMPYTGFFSAAANRYSFTL